MIEYKDLTIILPLYGRDEYTKVWIKDNFHNEFDYLIADGSLDNKNQEIFEKINQKNIYYYRYNPDLDYSVFVKKIVDISSKIRTPYVMWSDNDDFINFNGVYKCLNELKTSPSYDFAGGEIFFIYPKRSLFGKSNRYSFMLQVSSGMDLDNLSGYEGIKAYTAPNLKEKIYSLWYCAFRKEVFQKIWNKIYQLGIYDQQFVERAQTILAFNFGRYKHVKCCHYIRQSIPSTSSAVDYKKKNKLDFDQRLVFENKTRKQFFSLIDYINFSLKVDQKEIISSYLQIFSKRKDKLHSKTLIWIFKMRLLAKLIRFPAFSINNIRMILNVLTNLK